MSSIDKKAAKKAKKLAAAAAAAAAAATTAPIADEQFVKDAQNGNKRSADDSQEPFVAAKKAKLERDDTDGEDKEAKRARKAEKKAKKAAAKAAMSADLSAPAPALAEAPLSSSTDAAEARAYLLANSITIEAPEESTENPPLPMLRFAELKGRVDDRIKKTIDAQGFDKPTPIQACCWPVLLGGSDVVGIAETGSGKTFAFGLPALQHLMSSASSLSKKGKGKSSNAACISILIVAPTRELAIQTQENLAKIGDPLGMGSICLYGGVSKADQQRALRSSSPPIRIVVGTPGRVLDLAREEGSGLDLSNVTFLVLDEADRMLDKGFEPDIRAIIGLTRAREEGRRTSMFSATWPPAVRGLAESFMTTPVRVTVGSDELSANRRVEQTVIVLDDGREKERRLEALLRKVGAGPKGRAAKDKILIFALYKKEAQRVEGNLRRAGYHVAAIHGDMGQHERMASLDSFKSAATPLLVATDVAARGLDIPNVEYVVNYTFPLTIEDYVHRIGRTGRGGKTGKSVTYFTEEDKAHAGELMRVLRDADQEVPKEMDRFPATIKKKEHGSYGSHFRELVPGKAKKIVF